MKATVSVCIYKIVFKQRCFKSAKCFYLESNLMCFNSLYTIGEWNTGLVALYICCNVAAVLYIILFDVVILIIGL